MENQVSSRLCYPDPFKPVAIEFTLPLPALVTLIITNESGIELLNLLNVRHYEAGTHKFELREGMLSNGVYYYRLSTQPISTKDSNMGNAHTEVRKFRL